LSRDKSGLRAPERIDGRIGRRRGARSAPEARDVLMKPMSLRLPRRRSDQAGARGAVHFQRALTMAPAVEGEGLTMAPAVAA
jgi:hypothetical protein